MALSLKILMSIWRTSYMYVSSSILEKPYKKGGPVSVLERAR